MSLYPPNPIFSKADKKLLALLAKLLIEATDSSNERPNVPRKHVVLSDAEAKELTDYLELIANSRSFIEASFFAEAVTDPLLESQAKEIYLTARKRNGRDRMMASNQWASFQIRLGINVPGYQIVKAETMPLSYFKRMERKLLLSADLSPRVVDLLMSVVEQQENALADIRKQKRKLQTGLIKASVMNPVLKWAKCSDRVADRAMSREKVAGIMTVVADTTVMFTTRDWGVAGTLSTIAGALAVSSMD